MKKEFFKEYICNSLKDLKMGKDKDGNPLPQDCKKYESYGWDKYHRYIVRSKEV